jgi:uncharacterized protein DUF6544
VTAPPVPRGVRGEWARLRGDGTRPPPFDPASVAGLPEPARRWLRHAVAPGTPLWTSGELTMRGEIRLGAWRRFTARQVLAPPHGFVWAARTRLAGLPVTGFDRLSSGSGALRWRLAGLVPVMSADGPDVTRSAAGRLAGETVLAPTTARQCRWSPGADGDRAVATSLVAGVEERVELQVAPDGRLLGVTMQRWGDPGGAPFGRYPFGVVVEAEATFGGVTIPSVFRAGWWWGTDRQAEGEFFRAEVTGASWS